MQVVKQIRVFSILIFCLNLTYTLTGYLLLKKVGFYVLLILLHGGICTMVQYSKIYLITRTLQHEYPYYINNNIDQLNEPFFYQEMILDGALSIVKVLYLVRLISNYFRTVNLQFLLHLWLFYLVSDLQQQLLQLKKSYDSYQQFKRI